MRTFLHALAATDAPLGTGFFGLFPLALTLGGAALLVYAPIHRGKVEERVKNRAMTQSEARLHQNFLRVSAHWLTIIGGAQIAIKLYEILH